MKKIIALLIIALTSCSVQARLTVSNGREIQITNPVNATMSVTNTCNQTIGIHHPGVARVQDDDHTKSGWEHNPEAVVFTLLGPGETQNVPIQHAPLNLDCYTNVEGAPGESKKVPCSLCTYIHSITETE